METPAAWYQDPHDATRYRYWDGTCWTNHTSPITTEPGPHSAPAGQPSEPTSPTPTSRAQPTAISAARQLANQARAAVARTFGRPAATSQTDQQTIEILTQENARLRDMVTLVAQDDSADLLCRVDALRAIRQGLDQERDQLAQQAAASNALREEHIKYMATLEQQKLNALDSIDLETNGYYHYRHVLEDSVAYKSHIKELRERTKSMLRANGDAVLASMTWTINGSAAQGRKMVREFSKLMLRAYNAEADNLVRLVKPNNVQSYIDRLAKVSQTIEKLGQTMNIRINHSYHQLRVQEIELTADYRAKLAAEKEEARARRAEEKERAQLDKEIRQKRELIGKEHSHYANVRARLVAAGEDTHEVDTKIAEIEAAQEDLDRREANTRAGYVYVISNYGSFGPDVVKIGLTRRLDPMDRVKELGDASVPYRFDVHALFFSDDAVTIEAEMHRRLADRRLNLVNTRREYFQVTPAEAKNTLLQLKGDLLEFREDFEAEEFRESQQRRHALGAPELQPIQRSDSYDGPPSALPGVALPPQ